MLELTNDTHIVCVWVASRELSDFMFTLIREPDGTYSAEYRFKYYLDENDLDKFKKNVYSMKGATCDGDGDDVFIEYISTVVSKLLQEDKSIPGFKPYKDLRCIKIDGNPEVMIEKLKNDLQFKNVTFH